MNTTNVIKELATVKDWRSCSGKRHPLWLILLIVLMATMSGCYSLRAMADFVERHREALITKLELPKQRLPGFSTIRRVLWRLDWQQLSTVFHRWAATYVQLEPQEWLATDGKTINATVSNANNSFQDFVSLVSVFSARRGLVIAQDKFSNKEGSEIATVQALIQALDLEGVVFSFDALHCQKKLSS